MRLSARHDYCINRFAVIPSAQQPKIRVTALAMSSSAKQDKQDSSIKRVAVIGAGVSGLSAAYKLKLNGLDVTVFEADGRTGGKLRSILHDGLIWDEGANTMTESEAAVGLLLDNLGLRRKQQFPLSQQKRYIAKNGVPVLLPSNPIALVTSNLLSAWSKLQILSEPFSWKNTDAPKQPDTKESVGAFFQRHFGKEVVDYLIDPFVAGTNGGDPESLSMRHVFPELWNLEKRFGSIIAGAIQSKFSDRKGTSGGSSPKKKHKRGSFSFVGGMQTLTDALSNELGKDELTVRSRVLELSCCDSKNSPLNKWSVCYELDGIKRTCEKSFDALIVTAPLSNVKEMKITRRESPFLLDFIPEVSYLPMSVVVTTFKRENVKRPLEGFGVLVPSKEQQNGLKTLGTLFSSMMFPDRAPADLYLYTTFVGGSRNQELAKASRDELKQIVTSDLRQLLGAEGEPTFMNHFYWSKAFPLYGHNYDSVIQAIDKMERGLPGFFYAGNHKGGLSVGKAITSGCQAADLVMSYLNSTSDAKGNFS
ncbi:Protoporphyrinogen oxidase 2-chloroplastic/mitochondrial [Striga hermonthica]|uniref:Protoporphyrinogen oxidase n=1 Tax=Striga hermonthica TaxID=68872 RepID=A0A9N7N181_STRHE|nr:Protoporphyrinogen oxidase 2-chloroplastic/mitochondrial [Striga hermonthica]